MIEMMTQDDFIEKNGTICPVCKLESAYVTVIDGPSGAGDYCFEDCACDACGAIWTTEYKLSGYGNVEMKNNVK